MKISAHLPLCSCCSNQIYKISHSKPYSQRYNMPLCSCCPAAGQCGASHCRTKCSHKGGQDLCARPDAHRFVPQQTSDGKLTVCLVLRPEIYIGIISCKRCSQEPQSTLQRTCQLSRCNPARLCRGCNYCMGPKLSQEQVGCHIVNATMFLLVIQGPLQGKLCALCNIQVLRGVSSSCRFSSMCRGRSCQEPLQPGCSQLYGCHLQEPGLPRRAGVSPQIHSNTWTSVYWSPEKMSVRRCWGPTPAVWVMPALAELHSAAKACMADCSLSWVQPDVTVVCPSGCCMTALEMPGCNVGVHSRPSKAMRLRSPSIVAEDARQEHPFFERDDRVVIVYSAMCHPAVRAVQAETCTRILRCSGQCHGARELRAAANHAAGRMGLFQAVRPTGSDDHSASEMVAPQSLQHAQGQPLLTWGWRNSTEAPTRQSRGK